MAAFLGFSGAFVCVGCHHQNATFVATKLHGAPRSVRWLHRILPSFTRSSDGLSLISVSPGRSEPEQLMKIFSGGNSSDDLRWPGELSRSCACLHDISLPLHLSVSLTLRRRNRQLCKSSDSSYRRSRAFSEDGAFLRTTNTEETTRSDPFRPYGIVCRGFSSRKRKPRRGTADSVRTDTQELRIWRTHLGYHDASIEMNDWVCAAPTSPQVLPPSDPALSRFDMEIFPITQRPNQTALFCQRREGKRRTFLT